MRLSKTADTENMSLEGMSNDLRALCERQGWREVALHVDDGISGAVRERPAFTAWLDDARHGRADVLAAWHVDRMTREGLPVAAMLLDIVEGNDPMTGKPTRKGVRLMDCHGLDSDNAEGFRLLFVVRAEIARAERERMRARSKARTTRALAARRWSGGAVPYGYRQAPAPDGVGVVLEVDPAEAAVVRDVAERLLSGETLGRIVRSLNLAGVRPKRADHWTYIGLRKVMGGDAVLGHVRHGGGVYRDEQGYPVQMFPAILTPSEATEIRRLIQGTPSPASNPTRKTSRLLSGLAYCAACGGRLSVARSSRGAARYQCRATIGTCPVRAGISAEWLEDHVAREFLARFGWWPLIVERVVAGADADELARVSDAVAATLRDLAGNATPEAFARLQELQARQRELETMPGEPTREVIETGHTLADEWAARDGDTEGRRVMLSAYLAAVNVSSLGRGMSTARGQGADRVELVTVGDEGV